jgi:hypothetical protein
MPIFLLSVLMLAAGCTVSGDDPVTELGVARGAVVVEEGAGRLSHEPNANGRVWVYDADDDRLVYEGRVNRGDDFIVDARENRISLNGQRQTERDLRSNHMHRIYFKEE